MRRQVFLLMASMIALVPIARADQTDNGGIVEDLKDLDLIKELCLATREPGSVFLDGDPVERARAAARFKENRSIALQQLYRVRVSRNGFPLGDTHEARHGNPATVDLRLTGPLRALSGALQLTMHGQSVAPLALNVNPDSLDSGNPHLVVYFQLDPSRGAPCTGSVAAQVYTLATTPVAFELRDDSGHVLARGDLSGADRFRSLIGGYGGKPTAVLGAVVAEGMDTGEFSHRLEAAIEPMQRCYTERLKTRTDAGGAAVVGVSVDASGAVDSVTFIADALGDEELHKCVDESLRHVGFANVSTLPALFRVPVELKLVAQR